MSGGPEEEARAATLALLDRRRAGATICPSEVARAVAAAAGAADWRGAMAAVHAAVDSMVAQGLVRLSWKGKAIEARDGPYRIGRV
jgi:nucleoid-associated protein YgaU